MVSLVHRMEETGCSLRGLMLLPSFHFLWPVGNHSLFFLSFCNISCYTERSHIRLSHFLLLCSAPLGDLSADLSEEAVGFPVGSGGPSGTVQSLLLAYRTLTLSGLAGHQDSLVACDRKPITAGFSKKGSCRSPSCGFVSEGSTPCAGLGH